jgi:ribosome recycling factor
MQSASNTYARHDSVKYSLAHTIEGQTPMASIMANIPALKEAHTQLRSRMDKAVEDFRANLVSTRTGRASVHMLDQVRVDYYGTPTALSQVAQVNTPEAQMITVQPWDPSIIRDIEKAITEANLGLNPQNDGKMIRLPVPPMTEERRKEVVKHLSGILEGHRTGIRNIRRDGNDAIKKAAKDKLISADDEKRATEEVQQLTDAEIKKLEELFKAKEKEVLAV